MKGQLRFNDFNFCEKVHQIRLFFSVQRRLHKVTKRLANKKSYLHVHEKWKLVQNCCKIEILQKPESSAL